MSTQNNLDLDSLEALEKDGRGFRYESAMYRAGAELLRRARRLERVEELAWHFIDAYSDVGRCRATDDTRDALLKALENK